MFEKEDVEMWQQLFLSLVSLSSQGPLQVRLLSSIMAGVVSLLNNLFEKLGRVGFGSGEEAF